MNTIRSEHDDRRRELAAGLALDGLDDAERAELDALGGADPGDVEAFELAAAELGRALAEVDEASMPPEVAGRVVAAIESGARGPDARLAVAGAAPSRWGTFAGIAAAAGLVLAGVLVIRSIGPGPGGGRPAPPNRPMTQVEQARATLVNHAPDLTEMRWQATDHPSVRQARDQGLIGGELIWSSSLGEGYVRVCHLSENDPVTGRYRVWIWLADDVDGAPIAAGTFDVRDTADFTTIRLDLPPSDAAPVRAHVTFDSPETLAMDWTTGADARAVLLQARFVDG